MLLSIEDILFVGKRMMAVKRCFLMNENKSSGICKVSSTEAGSVMAVSIHESWRLSNTVPANCSVSDLNLDTHLSWAQPCCVWVCKKYCNITLVSVSFRQR